MTQPSEEALALAKFIIDEWAAFECEPDPVMEGDAVNALILARALVAIDLLQ